MVDYHVLPVPICSGFCETSGVKLPLSIRLLNVVLHRRRCASWDLKEKEVDIRI